MKSTTKFLEESSQKKSRKTHLLGGRRPHPGLPTTLCGSPADCVRLVAPGEIVTCRTCRRKVGLS